MLETPCPSPDGRNQKGFTTENTESTENQKKELVARKARQKTL